MNQLLYTNSLLDRNMNETYSYLTFDKKNNKRVRGFKKNIIEN